MGYSIDLSKISIDRYKEILKNQNLLPGRRMLLENLDNNFDRITNAGVRNLAELKSSLSSKQKLSAFAEKTGISEDYLTILKREMGSLEQKPVPFSDFPGIPGDIVSALLSKGIKSSKDVYEMDNVPDELQELYSLCNLVRINGVGSAAARTLYESGYKSVIEIAGAKAAELLEGMNIVNADKKYYKANLGEKDMQFIIDAANFIVEQEKNKHEIIP